MAVKRTGGDNNSKKQKMTVSVSVKQKIKPEIFQTTAA